MALWVKDLLCHWRGSSGCCGMGLIPSVGTSTCCGCSQKKKRAVRRNQPCVGRGKIRRQYRLGTDGVPVMDQQVWSLALLSALKIWRCLEMCRLQTCLDPRLLWLWCMLAAAAPICPLAWELPYAMGAVLKWKRKKSYQPCVGRHRIRRSCMLGIDVDIKGVGNFMSSSLFGHLVSGN